MVASAALLLVGCGAAVQDGVRTPDEAAEPARRESERAPSAPSEGARNAAQGAAQAEATGKDAALASAAGTSSANATAADPFAALEQAFAAEAAGFTRRTGSRE